MPSIVVETVPYMDLRNAIFYPLLRIFLLEFDKYFAINIPLNLSTAILSSLDLDTGASG
jgi:hypothetical protein